MGEDLYFVVLFEEDQWVAHGLQHNVMTHGRSLNEVRENVRLLIRAYVEEVGLDALSKIPPATAPYWERFIAAQKLGRDLDQLVESITPGDHEIAYLEMRAA
jgi:predicted RNase H-like HicB family nuclease